MLALKLMWRWLYREIPLWWSTRPRRASHVGAYLVPAYKVPRIPHFEDIRIERRYRMFSSRRWRGYGTLQVLPIVNECVRFQLDKAEDELNYFHFHFDLLGKLKTLDDSGVSHRMPLWIKPSLAQDALFREARMRGSLKHRTFITDPSAYNTMLQVTAPPITAALTLALRRYVGAPPAMPSDKRTYLMRSGARKPTNQARLIRTAAYHGFEAVDPAALSYAEQMTLFAQTRWLIMEHGAGEANIIFRRGPLSVIELQPETKLNATAFYICQSIGATHHPIVCSIAEGVFKPGYEDYYVNVREFDQAIRRSLRAN